MTELTTETSELQEVIKEYLELKYSKLPSIEDRIKEMKVSGFYLEQQNAPTRTVLRLVVG